MSDQKCAVCGIGGYWVGYDRVAREDRCVTHLAHNALAKPQQSQPTEPELDDD